MFNKGMLMNAGFTEVKRRGQFDCYIFHDVDMLAEDDRNMYTCSKSPRHLGVYIKKYRYRFDPPVSHSETVCRQYTLSSHSIFNHTQYLITLNI